MVYKRYCTVYVGNTNTLTTAAWSMAAVILNRAAANTINQTNEHLAGLIKHQFGDIF
jgi:hypothetical protein